MVSNFKAIVYCELTESDISKAHARGNIASTGGGARDLRFPFAPFDVIFKKILSKRRFVKRVGGTETLAVGQLLRDPILISPTFADIDDLIWEPPTKARPGEGRLAKVHMLRGISRLFTSINPAGKKFLVLIQGDDGYLRAHLAEENDILTGKWSAIIADPIRSRLSARAKKAKNSHKRIMGWIDVETGENVHG